MVGREKRTNGQEDALCLASIFPMLALEHLISNPEIHVETKLQGSPGKAVFNSPTYRGRHELQLEKPVHSIGRQVMRWG